MVFCLRRKGAKDAHPRTRRRKAEIAVLRQSVTSMQHGMDMQQGLCGIPGMGPGLMDKDLRAVHGAMHGA